MPPGRQPSKGSPRDRQPRGTYQPPKPKQQKIPKGNQFSDLPGIIDPLTGAVTGVADKHTRPDPNRLRRGEVLRRQRLLKQTGYGVVVDGIWGPRSAKAWRDFLHRQRAGDLRNSPYRREKQRDGLHITTFTPEGRQKGAKAVGVTPQEIQRERERIQLQQERETKKEQARLRAEILDQAHALRKYPQVARSMSLRDVTDVLVDRETKMGLDTQAGALVMQHWLQSHGHPEVKVTGVYDRKTHAIVERVYRQHEKKALRRVAKAIGGVYKHAGIKPGDKPDWMPGMSEVPKIKDFAKMLQEGGFTASMMFRAMLKNAQRPPEWNALQEMGMRKVMTEVGPNVLALREAIPGMNMSTWEMYHYILGITDLSALPDLSGVSAEQEALQTGQSTLEVMAERANNKKLREDNAAKVFGLRAEVAALMNSKSTEDFKKNLLAQNELAEAKFRAFQAEVASQSTSYFGTAVDAILKPGRVLRTATMYGLLEGLQSLDEKTGLFDDMYVGPDGKVHSSHGAGRDIIWEDAMAVLGEHPEEMVAYDQLFEATGRIRRLGLEIFYDPLNVAHPFRTASQLARWSGLGGESLGALSFRMGTKGGAVRRAAAGGFKWNRGTWSKADLAERAITPILSPQYRPAYDKMLYEARKFTALREEALEKAQSWVAVQGRHLFEQPRHALAAKGWLKKTPKNAVALKQETDAMKHHILTTPEWEPTVQALIADAASFFTHADYVTPSDYNAWINAEWAEMSRVSSIQERAGEAAMEARRHGFDQGMSKEELSRYVQSEFMKVLDAAGVYIKGGQSSVEFMSDLTQLVGKNMEDMQKVFIPALQSILEDNAELVMAQADNLRSESLKAGRQADEPMEHPLWRETPDGDMIWRGHDAEPAELIRKTAAAGFVDTVPQKNPAWRVGHTQDEMLLAVDAEVARGVPRMFAYSERKKALDAGHAFDPLETARAFKDDLLRKHWKPGDGSEFYPDSSKFYDTREEIQVNARYARHQETAYQELVDRAGLLNSGMDLDEWFGIIAAAPQLSWESNLEQSLWKLNWMMGNRYPAVRGLQHPTRRSFVPDTSGLSKEDAKRFLKEEFDRGDAMRTQVAKTKGQLKLAAEDLYPGALARERLFMTALSRHQSRFAKAAYNVLHGSMVMWRFMVLPLRFGWVVINQIDNVTKAMIEGAWRDPRAFFRGAAQPGKTTSRAMHSVLAQDIGVLRQFISIFDRYTGTKGLDAFDRILNQMWELEKPVHDAIFNAHGIPPMPEAVLEGTRMQINDYAHRARGVGSGFTMSESDYKLAGMAAPKEKAVQGMVERIAKGTDLLWDMFGARPENYMKRVIYQTTYAKALREDAPMFTRLNAANAEGTGYAIQAKDFEIDDAKLDELRKREGVPEGVTFSVKFTEPPVPIGPHHFSGAFAPGDTAVVTTAELDDFVNQLREQALRTWYNDVTEMMESRIGQLRAEGGEEALREARHTQASLDAMRDAFQSNAGIDNLRSIVQDTEFDLPFNDFFGPGSDAIRASTPERVVQSGEMPFMNGAFNPYDGTARVEVSSHVRSQVQTMEQLDALIADITRIAVHELRHAWFDKVPARMSLSNSEMRAFTKWRMKLEGDPRIPGSGKERVWWDIFGKDPKTGNPRMFNLLYKTQIHEIDANLASKLRTREYRGLVKYNGPELPKQTVNEVALISHAHEEAWDKVVDTLFDYSRITTIEDSLKILFPFIMFWRKNSAFWMKQFSNKPYLSNAVLQIDNERRDAHKDLPPWMQRYLHTDEIVDAAAVVPGLDIIVEAMLPDDGMFDPFRFLSFAPIHRVYRELAYGDNQLMPGDNPGMMILGPMLDAMNDFGLTMSPLVRKPLEAVGVASERSWQMVFPQTGLLVALTREFISDSAALKLASWESAFDRLPTGVKSDAIAENFEFYVQQEIAGQAARGEPLNREKAEATIRAWFLTQNVWGYFSGVYFRRATPEDIYLSKLQWDAMSDPEVYGKLSDKEKGLLKLWSMRGYDRLTYNRYLDMLPLIEAYYRLEDPAEKHRLVEKNPELRRYVSSTFRGKPFSGGWMRSARKQLQTQQFFHALRVVEAVDPAQDVRDAALDVFATPELRAYWRANDTPAQIRDRQIKGEAQRYFRDLNSEYHSIPETDFEARDGFLEENPELIRHWNRNNRPVDDFEALLQSGNAMLREQYFDLVESKGWDAAAWLLKRHPFMFEDTDSAHKIDEKAGEWKHFDKDGKQWSAERLAAFREAKPHLSWFFDKLMKQVGEKKAWAWLEGSSTPQAKLIKDYLKKYAKHSAAALAYLKAKPWLAIFYDMPEEDRNEWLNGDSEGAKIVRWYFKNWAGKNGLSAHAKDYLDTKTELDFYFGMSKEKRSAWLESGDPRARKVLDYFKKYGKNHQYERLIKKFPQLAGGTPEQRKRMLFWKRFYELPPDQRPAYVIKEAENHGVFIYGEFGETERHDNEMDYMRRAVGLGLNKRQGAFLYIRPLLQFYNTLEEGEKGLFLRANPELQEYFDKYVTSSPTGDKQLDVLMEQYFKLPLQSFARSDFLKKHPEVQDYFDKRSSPAERAMRNLLEQYFSLGGFARRTFDANHPEIAAYFEQRREERSNENELFDAFDKSDPRLAHFFESAEQVAEAAEQMRQRLNRMAIDSMDENIDTRRERRELSRYV